MEATTSFVTSARTSSSSSTLVLGASMSLQATMATSVRVAASSSPTTHKFLAKNGFKEEEGGEENIEGFIHKSKGFLSMNFPKPKVEFF